MCATLNVSTLNAQLWMCATLCAQLWMCVTLCAQLWMFNLYARLSFMIILINADAYCIVFVLRKYRFGHICLLKFKLIVRLTLSAIESAPIIKMVVGDLYRRLGGYTVGAWDGDRRSRWRARWRSGGHTVGVFALASMSHRAPTRSPTISKSLIFIGARTFWTAQKNS